MFYLDPTTQKRYTLGTPFNYGGIQYTSAGATHARFVSLGFNQVIVQPRPDARFYIVTGPSSNGSYTSTPRDLDEVKASFIGIEKQRAFSELRSTDWYVLRFIDMGFTDPAGAIPEAIKTYRNDVREISNKRCQEIYATTSIAELETLINGDTMTVMPTLDTNTYAVYS